MKQKKNKNQVGKKAERVKTLYMQEKCKYMYVKQKKKIRRGV